MRLRSLLLALLFVLPMAMADQGSGQDSSDDTSGSGSDGSSDGSGSGPSDGPDSASGESADNATEDGASGDGGSGRSGRGDGSLEDACRGRDDTRECVQDYCEENGGEACVKHIREACDDGDCPALRQACLRASGDDDARRLCTSLTDAEDLRSDARYVDFVVDRDGRALRNYSVDGIVIFASMEYADNATGFEADRHGARIRFETDDSRLEIHDTPTGQFWYRSEDSPLTLMLPPGASATQSATGIDIRVDGRQARLVGSDLHLAGDVITVMGHASFTSPAQGSPRADAVEAARASQHLGAEIDVSAGEDGIVAYDDINITIDGDLASGMRVVLGAGLDSGRTFILDLPAGSGSDLNLSYYDILDDGNETQVVFRMASSMEDALDPDDDGGQPEYWVFEDADGVHVMVSVPHWSVHAIELQSLGIVEIAPSVALGIAAGMVGVAVAGVAMFWPRKRDE